MGRIEIDASKSGQVKMRLSRGGYRPGAGRKPIGETRQFKLSLPPEIWAKIDERASGRRTGTAIREILCEWYEKERGE